MPTRMPLEAIAAELAADPRFEVAEETHRTGVTEVRHPTCRERVHFAQHAVETDAAVTTCNLPDTVLGTLEAVGRDRQCSVEHQTVPKELTFVDPSHRALQVPCPTHQASSSPAAETKDHLAESLGAAPHKRRFASNPPPESGG